MSRNAPAVILLAGCGFLFSGCGGSQDEAVESTVDTFYEAVVAGEGDAACEVLAPATLSELEQSTGKPCAEAVLSEGVPDVAAPRRIEVFGTMAQVEWDGEVTFLSRFEDGWRVVAAACAPARSHYDCSIMGA